MSRQAIVCGSVVVLITMVLMFNAGFFMHGD